MHFWQSILTLATRSTAAAENMTLDPLMGVYQLCWKSPCVFSHLTSTLASFWRQSGAPTEDREDIIWRRWWIIRWRSLKYQIRRSPMFTWYLLSIIMIKNYKVKLDSSWSTASSAPLHTHLEQIEGEIDFKHRDGGETHNDLSNTFSICRAAVAATESVIIPWIQ